MMYHLSKAVGRMIQQLLGFKIISRCIKVLCPLSYEIRPVDPERDLDSLACFGNTLRPAARKMTRALYQRELEAASRDLLFLVAAQKRGDKKANVAGFIRVMKRNSGWWVMGLEVRPQYWRRGIAEALCREAMHRLQKSEVARLNLSVKKVNAAAIVLYRKLGFVEKPFPGEPLVGPPDIGMALDLG